MGVVRRSILIDEPSNEDHFNGKGHQRTAVALSKAIANFSEDDRAIGLDGPWGSGKSTVVEIARKILYERKTSENRAYYFFTFDIWQSQGSSFRRSLLEHFLEWTIVTFPAHAKALNEVEEKVKGKVREVRSNNRSILDWWGVLVIAFLPFLPIYYFWARKEFTEANGIGFLGSYSFLALLLFVGVTIGWSFFKAIREWRRAKRRSWRGVPGKFKSALSQTLLIGSKQFENQTVTQYIREVDPNDFEFQTTLREILSIVQSDNVRVVIVLDNIDRLPKKELNDYWAQVRAVFSGSPAVKEKDASGSVTVIVPYDRHLVEEKTQADSEKKTDSEKKVPVALTPLGAREIFTKTFDEILQVSPPVMSNTREFFIEKMGDALPEVMDRDELFRVYLIFDRIIRAESGSATPRQIIGFINELAGMYDLHSGRFKLPTVAVYIAYQDALEADPNLLNNPNSLDQRVREIANDEELEKNLSAMIFNVEPDLALQLLLDQRIKDAAVDSSERLIEISKSAGFDVRVNHVIQENVDEWKKSGDFSDVVSHFAALSKVYVGDAKDYYQESLVSSVMHMGDASYSREDFEKLLAVTELAEPERLPNLVRALIEQSHAAAVGGHSLVQVDEGVRWVSVVGSLRRKVAAEGSGDIFPSVLEDIEISHDARFTFGVAAQAAKEGMRLAWFKHGGIDFGGENRLYFDLAVHNPAQMRMALPEIVSADILHTTMVAGLFSNLAEQLQAPEIDDLPRFREQLQLTAEIYTMLSTDGRAGLGAEKIFEASSFFDHLSAALESPSDPALGDALFLAMQAVGLPLATPLKKARNGSILADLSEAFTKFTGVLSTGEGIAPEQIDRLAQLFKAADIFGSLISLGAAQPDNKLTREAIGRGLRDDNVPTLDLPTLNTHFEFLKSILGKSMTEVLVCLEERIADEDTHHITLGECSVGLLHHVREIRNGNWTKLRERVSRELDAVPVTDWPSHVLESDHLGDLLLEMIEGSDFRIADPVFRDVVVQMVLDVLEGGATPTGKTRLDLLVEAIDPRFHGDMYRQVRERVKDVTRTNLKVAVQYLPVTVSNVIRTWEQLRKDEKDVLVRFFLCSALEGGLDTVINDFEALGQTKVKDMIGASQESTREKLQGAMNTFAEKPEKKDRAIVLGRLFYGERKVKSVFERWFRSGAD